jgi:YD repeat-containing protein
VFDPNAGRYQRPKGLFLTLARSGDGWILVDQKWRVTAFDSLGRLAYESDEFGDSNSIAKGNVIRYLYDRSGRVTQIIDPVGRLSTLSYYAEGDVREGRLRQIADWRDRAIDYDYDAQGRLTSAHLPEVVNTSGARPAIRYAYAAPAGSFNDRLDFSGNLSSIVDPIGGPPRVAFTYGDAVARDRVLSQSWTATGESASFTYVGPQQVHTVDALRQKREYTLSTAATNYYAERAHIERMSEKEVATSATSFGALPNVAGALAPLRAAVDRSFSFVHDAEGQLVTSKLDGVATASYGYLRIEPQAPGTLLQSMTVTPVNSASPITRSIEYQTGPNAATFLKSMSAGGLSIATPEMPRSRETRATNDDVTTVTKANDFGQLIEVASSGGTDAATTAGVCADPLPAAYGGGTRAIAPLAHRSWRPSDSSRLSHSRSSGVDRRAEREDDREQRCMEASAIDRGRRARADAA